MSLLPCPACARHVRVTDATCQFCGHTLPASVRPTTRAVPTAKLGRGAVFAFGVALSGATMLGCGDDDGPTPGVDSGAVPADSGGGVADSGGRDGGGGGTDAGGGGTDAGGGGTDAGGGATDAGTDAGGTGNDAGTDAGGGIAPPYGAPPEP